MSEKRRDNKKRILRNGESQRSDGRYAYKYMGNDGKPHFAYSWKLEKTDSLPSGKRDCEALREQEKRIAKDLAKTNVLKLVDNLTVHEFVDRYIDSRKTLRDSTVYHYKSSLSLLQKYPLSNKKVLDVTVADAKNYAMALNETHAYGTIATNLAVIKAAFSDAVENGELNYNPFSFKLSKIIPKDTVPKSSINKTDKDIFLNFCRTNKPASKSMDVIIILLGTGMRISELCGLTFDDIDMEKGIIFIRHQMYKKGKEFRLVPPKSSAGIRAIPMSNEVHEAFERVIADRSNAKIPEYANFLFLTNRGKPTDYYSWDAKFRNYVKHINKVEACTLAPITPHLCRHTFCSDMVLDGINLKVLQKIMGHSSLQMTADRYAHINDEEEIVKEFRKTGR